MDNVQAAGSEYKRVKAMDRKVQAADERRKTWADEYNVDKLEGYYSGVEQKVPGIDEIYVINMCQPSVEQRLPALMFNRPKFGIKPQVTKADDVGQSADPVTSLEARCQIREDTLNGQVSLPDVGFLRATKLALREAHYSFGMVEVGFDTDATENPNAGAPVLKDDGTEMTKKDGSVLKQGEFLLKKEWLWVKRIPAANFRVSTKAHNDLNKCEWVGYFEWMSIADLKKNRKYKNVEKLKPSGRLNRNVDDSPPPAEVDDEQKNKDRGLVKVWKMWDNRANLKYVWVENTRFFLLEGENFKFLPLADLRFYELMDEFFCVPVMYNWTPVQDEMNESRNMAKFHRKRFVRRYLAKQGKLSDNALDQLRNGPDGTVIQVANMDDIRALEDAPLDRAVYALFPSTREDFVYVSAVPAEARGVAESETATQAQIINANQQIRESEAREVVANWLCRIGWLMMKTIEENFSEDMWVLQNCDPLGLGFEMEAARIAANWQKIKIESISGLEFAVTLNVEELAPMTDSAQQQKWEGFLGLMVTPGVSTLLSLSPALLKRTLAYRGIRGDKEQAEITQALTILAIAQASQGNEGSGGGGKTSDDGGKSDEGSKTPTPSDTQAQTDAQVPGK